jgi:hypothetical protein
VLLAVAADDDDDVDVVEDSFIASLFFFSRYLALVVLQFSQVLKKQPGQFLNIVSDLTTLQLEHFISPTSGVDSIDTNRRPYPFKPLFPTIP